MLSKENNYYCSMCCKQYYPSFNTNLYEGIDVIREQSIINNRDQDFTLQSGDGKNTVKGVEALKKILVHSSDRWINKTSTFNNVRDEETDEFEFDCINHYLENEGNNIAFLSKHISNVILRWDANIDKELFFHKEGGE